MPDQRPARKQLFEMAEDGVPVEKRVFGDGSLLRPPFIQPYDCKNVLIEGVRVRLAVLEDPSRALQERHGARRRRVRPRS